eukprot:SAG31_NODE_2949_length_4871_cov_2.742456_6_plen_410_part_00
MIALSNVFATDFLPWPFAGGRMDLDADRHFKGKLASVTVANQAMTAEQAACIFTANNGLLPALPHCNGMIAEMMIGGNFELDISFLGTVEDTSGHDVHIVTYGDDVVVTSTGVRFDGEGDYMEIENIDYESDGDFTIAFWITKDDCTEDSTFEYLYSHVEFASGPHASIDDRANSNVNIYVACDHDSDDAEVSLSTAGGTVLRFNLIDSNGVWALMDYPLAAAGATSASPFPIMLVRYPTSSCFIQLTWPLALGQFDQITETWTSVIMTVTRHAVSVFVNGDRVPDSEYGFPVSGSCEDMQIRPSCAQLRQSYACDTDMQILTGNDPHYQGQTLSEYCQATCHACHGGIGAGHGVNADMLADAAYPYPSSLRTPFTTFTLESPIFLGTLFFPPSLIPSRVSSTYAHFKC